MNLLVRNYTKIVLMLIACFVVGQGYVFAEADPNRFNRLMLPSKDRHPPLAKDGIHDPAAPGVASLQAPKDAFSKLSKGKSGNYIDWGSHLTRGKLTPWLT